MAQNQPGIAIIVVAALLAGCGQETSSGAGTPAVIPGVSPSGVQQVLLPDSFPEAFPLPPDNAPLLSTQVVENAVLSNDLREEHGTVLGTTVWYAYDSSDSSEVERLLDHYRESLPAAGWTITTYEPPSRSEEPWRDRPGHRLRVDGHGYHSMTVTVEQDETISLRVSVTEITEGRKPSEHPPLVTMPDWYQALPDPPEGLRRYQVRITARLDEPTTYYIGYEHETQQPDRDTDDDRTAGVLAGHYQNTLPAAGWTVMDLRERTESSGREGHVVERHHSIVEFDGHQVVGTVHASQAVSAAGQWLGSGVSVTIYPGGQRPASDPIPGPTP